MANRIAELAVEILLAMTRRVVIHDRQKALCVAWLCLFREALLIVEGLNAE